MLKKIAQKIEIKFGYSSNTQFVVCLLYFFTSFFSVYLKKRNKKVLIVSLGLPGYLENILDVLDLMVKKNYEIHVFPEWVNEKKFDEQLKPYLKKNYTFHFESSRVLPLIKCNIFLSSIAGKKYYFPLKGKRLFYFHSTAAMDGFPPNALDAYDVILSATIQQRNQLLKLYGKQKIILDAGYPKLDKIRKKIANIKFETVKNKRIRVIYAPSYVNDEIYKNLSIHKDSEKIIKKLLDEGFDVVFRPHPLMFKSPDNSEFIYEINNKFKKQNLELDSKSDYFNTYCNSDVMITDISGTSLIYKVGFRKPVVFLTPDINKAVASFSLISKIGPVIDNVNELIPTIKKLNNDKDKTRRDDLVFNLDKSVKYFVYIINKFSI